MDKELSTLWHDVLAELKTNASQGFYAGFLKSTSLASLEGNTATIAVPTAMAISWIRQRVQREIKVLLDKYTQKDIAIAYIVKSTLPKSKKLQEQEGSGPLFAGEEKKSEAAPKPLVGHLPRVRAEYTFSSFAVSGTNNLAFVSATHVAQHIGTSYNPFFIYGPVGVGKTHLMHAIANEAYRRDPDKKVLYITSEEFTNEVVEAIKNNDTARMKRRFRTANILLIDDVQFIEGKEKVQEELFHTFNILVDNGSQICLTSDRPPQEIKKLEKRLSSRFAGGLSVDIGEPDLELKTAILKKKAEKLGYILPIDVALFLGENARDTRSLEGLLFSVINQAATNHQEISIDLAKRALGAAGEEKRNGHVHAEDIIDRACTYFNIKHTQLRGQKRDAFLVRARQVVSYILYEKLGVKYVQIGNLLGGRDHTTIMHGVDKMRILVENKDGVIVDIEWIIQMSTG